MNLPQSYDAHGSVKFSVQAVHTVSLPASALALAIIITSLRSRMYAMVT